MLLFLNLSFGEITLVMLFILIFFGAESIPKIARTLGKGMRQIKDATNEIQQDIQNSTKQISKDLNDPLKED